PARATEDGLRREVPRRRRRRVHRRATRHVRDVRLRALPRNARRQARLQPDRRAAAEIIGPGGLPGPCLRGSQRERRLPGGPNGAGKTTTLRMLVGLVHPNAGEARLFGARVKPGVQTLRRVGVLVEEPAFVPYLSGMKNLELFWRAGSQKMSEADLDGSLEVADLGDAINRKVKTYSHGMKQRLGIAQALLGKPDLLILDEPTTGLDPQQMREMRDLVRSIAQRGATVLLSSHLLGEVEQVCSH